MTKKARSRLTSSASTGSTRFNRASGSNFGQRLLKRYLAHIPTLLLSLPFWGATLWIIQSVRPATIADVIIPNGYLPLVIPLWLALGLTATFLCLRTRRGLAVATGLVLFFWLRIRAFEWSWPTTVTLISLVLLPLLLVELLDRFVVSDSSQTTRQTKASLNQRKSSHKTRSDRWQRLAKRRKNQLKLP